MHGTRRAQGESTRTFRFYDTERCRLVGCRNNRPEKRQEKVNNNDASLFPEVCGDHLTAYEKDEIRSYAHVYYSGEKCLQKIQAPVEGGYNSGYDDEKGDYVIKLRDHIAYRYDVLEILGSGSFGQVVKVFDCLKKNVFALKIIRNKKRFTMQAKIEVQILAHLRKNDPKGVCGVVQMLDSFSFRSHTCIVYELLSINLYEFLKRNNFYPLSLTLVRKIGAGLLVSLSYIWRENIIHCDLKPENILLRSSERTSVKVIDFGSSCYENARIYSYIQSRFYRAPEVILGCSYSKRIDLWSYGCVLCELATGTPIFPGENERDQLACIMEYLGPPPQEMISKSPRKKEFFDANAGYAPKLVLNSKRRMRYPGTRSLAVFLGLSKDDEFVSFVEQFLRWTPADRISPQKAMRHAWVADIFGKFPALPSMASQGQGNTKLRGANSNAASNNAMLSTNMPHLPKIGQ